MREATFDAGVSFDSIGKVLESRERSDDNPGNDHDREFVRGKIT